MAAPPVAALTEALLVAQKRSLEMLAQGKPLPEVLASLVDVVESHSPVEAVGSILILDQDGRLRTGSAPSLPEAYSAAIDGLKASEDLGTCSVAAVTGRTVITPDFESDPKWAALKHLPLGLGLKGAWSQPILGCDGRVLGTFGTYFRTIRQPSALEQRLVETLAQTAALAIAKAQEQAAGEARSHALQLAMEAAELGAWRYTLADNICEFDTRAQALYGAPSARFLHDEAGVLRLLCSEDVPVMWKAVGRACDPAGDGRYQVEYRTRRPEGGWRWLSVWGVAEFEGSGPSRRAVALVGASRDVSDRKLAEDRQRLLINELNHRVKNTLATVQSIARHTLKRSPTLDAASHAFDNRIMSLARAHDLLTEENWSGADLAEIVRRAIDPFAPAGRFVITGPPARLSAERALALSMLLHELATNATKYGALSSPGGRVELSWDNFGQTIELRWCERGGPAVSPPTRMGFGTRLLQGGLPGGSAAQTRLTYAPEGLECALNLEKEADILPAPASVRQLH